MEGQCISRISLAVTRIRSDKAEPMSKSCRRTRQPIASEKKGGRKKASTVQPELVDALRDRIEVHTAGSAVEPGCLWTNRSTRELSVELLEDGFMVSPNTIDHLLRDELDLGRRQALKTVPLGESVHRNEQFARIAELKSHFFRQGWPVVSVDTKKKVDLGDFFRHGQGWTNGFVRALDHDFPSAGLGKVIPYGVYDLAANEAFLLLAMGADTGEISLRCDSPLVVSARPTPI